MQFQIGDTLNVQLTQAGLKAYRKYWDKKSHPQMPIPDPVESGSSNWYLMSVWEFLEICGLRTKNKRCRLFTSIAIELNTCNLQITTWRAKKTKKE